MGKIIPFEKAPALGAFRAVFLDSKQGVLFGTDVEFEIARFAHAPALSILAMILDKLDEMDYPLSAYHLDVYFMGRVVFGVDIPHGLS